jgi:hypothetical protein
MRNCFKIAFLAVLAIGLFIGDPSHAHHVVAHAPLLEHLTLGHGFGLAGAGAIPIFIGSTGKVVLRDINQFMADYKPVYQPLYPLFLGNSQQYAEEVGTLNFKRLETIGDVRAKHITPKDTDIKQITVKEGSKTFKRYFLAKQFRQSSIQDQTRTEDVVKQVLDEHQKQFDEIFVMGEGTSNSDVFNNGLFWSGDGNLTVNGSYQLLKATDAGHAVDLHSKVMEQAELANVVAGRKVVIYYGTNIVPIVNGLFASYPGSVKARIQESLGQGYAPSINLHPNLTPASNHGFMIVNLDQIKLHYTTLPTLKAQGVNEENMYSWHNFLTGSCMTELLTLGAVTKQPLTLEA